MCVQLCFRMSGNIYHLVKLKFSLYCILWLCVNNKPLLRNRVRKKKKKEKKLGLKKAKETF